MTRKAYFSGRFDPVHYGHRDTARIALANGMDIVYIDPVFLPAKNCMAPYDDRMAMVGIMFRGEEGVEVIDMDRVLAGELGRKPEMSERAGRICDLHPADEVYWLTGTDTLPGYCDGGLEQMPDDMKIIAVKRHGFDSIAPPEDERIILVDGETIGSSREVIRRLRNGDDVGDLLPEDILKYIDGHGLYRD